MQAGVNAGAIAKAAALEAQSRQPSPPGDPQDQDKIADLERQLEAQRAQTDLLVADGIRAKLKERQAEVDRLERQAAMAKESAERSMAYVNSLDAEAHRTRGQRTSIDEMRLALVALAAVIQDEWPAPSLLDDWRKLAGALADAAAAVETFIRTPPAA